MENNYVLILAGGLGKRMKSKIPKVLHKVGKISMLSTIIHNKNGYWNDHSISPDVRQRLQHWGYRLTKKDYETYITYIIHITYIIFPLLTNLKNFQ